MRRVTLGALLATLLLVVMPRPAGAAPASTVPTARPGVQLLGQTPWVQNSGRLTIRVAVVADSPANDSLEVSYFPQLHTRTNFDDAAAGHIRSYSTYSTAIPIGRLPADPAGGFDVSIPVDTAAPPGSPLAEFSTDHTGVFPIQVAVINPSQRTEGSPLTTFLVYAAGTNTPLSVAVVVPFSSSPSVGTDGNLRPPDQAEADRLNRLATLLNGDGTLHTSVLTSPLTLTALQEGSTAGSSTDRNTLANLAGVPQDGLVQVLPSTYSQVAPGDLVNAGLGGEADQQVATASAGLQSVYGVAPDPGTWVVNGPLDSATLGFLQAHHASSLIVPSSDLTAYNSSFTVASTGTLDYGYARFKVAAADAQLTADFAADEPPVLAANQLLAELAMIQTEQPYKSRAVTALPPSGWSVSPDFMATLLTGLNGNPLIQTVTASGLFSSVPPPDVTRELANPYPPPGRAASALESNSVVKSIEQARREITGLSSLGADQPALATMNAELLAAEAENIGSGTRNALLNAVSAAKAKMAKRVGLPGSTSITLTSTQGQLPITVLSSLPSRAEVHLVLTSQRLIFKPAGPRDGTCSVPVPTQEICTLSLVSQNTTLKVPVETRSSGVFPLTVEVFSPDGVLQLAKNRDTVRSTAVSGVGVVLIIVAVLSLAVWWGRDLRHGRRPGRMAPAPDRPPDDEVDLGDDPAVHDFFNSKPPQYDRSGRRSG